MADDHESHLPQGRIHSPCPEARPDRKNIELVDLSTRTVLCNKHLFQARTTKPTIQLPPTRGCKEAFAFTPYISSYAATITAPPETPRMARLGSSPPRTPGPAVGKRVSRRTRAAPLLRPRRPCPIKGAILMPWPFWDCGFSQTSPGVTENRSGDGLGARDVECTESQKHMLDKLSRLVTLAEGARLRKGLSEQDQRVAAGCRCSASTSKIPSPQLEASTAFLRIVPMCRRSVDCIAHLDMLDLTCPFGSARTCRLQSTCAPTREAPE